jgi:3-dehydroquinate synthase|tara:strand:- start:1068 stop:2159 length:1092 start_codon:yes stop_codon:yes gene_type:complete
MEIIQLDLGAHSYPIYIGQGLIADGGLLRSHIQSRQVFIVSNETVGPLYRQRVVDSLDGFQVDCLDLPDGEEFKDLENLNLIFTTLLQKKHNRSTTLIAIGGGVTGDTAGFAAACYQRGIDLIQIPTSLLSQVDASVGGKTAVNHPLGKNMIGAFYQPKCVLIDIETLNTLPKREFVSGLAEVIKHGLIRDPQFFQWLEANLEAVLSLQEDSLSYIVKRNCEIKAEVVSADEKERGMRALLNLGHTFGHAVETAMGYGNWLHGEAVGVGMVMAADLSARMGRLAGQECSRIKTLVGRAGLPVSPPAEIEPNRYIDLMQVDKKAIDGTVRFVLLDEIGAASLVDDVDRELLLQTLSAGTALCDT